MKQIIGKKLNEAAINSLLTDVRKLDDDGASIYIGYPILSTSSESFTVPATLVSKKYGLVIFDLSENAQPRPGVEPSVEDLAKHRDKLYSALQSKLISYQNLLEKRELAVRINVLTYFNEIPHYLKNNNDELVASVSFCDTLKDLKIFDEKYFEPLNSAIQRVSTIRPKERRDNAVTEGSRGSILKIIEATIANLDPWQNEAAIETPDGVQRIRGLAGSGKTIVLALKAAYLHSENKDWKIAVSFYTQSLYGQFERLIQRFYFEDRRMDPDWEKIKILHSYGSSSKPGLYSEICRAYGIVPNDFGYAKRTYGRDLAFQGICRELLDVVTKNPKELFDVVLIDEAQDLPKEFLKLAYLCTRKHRIVFAYDDLQNLGAYEMESVKQIFDDEVDLTNKENEPKRDIILPICYRNTPWALVTAHALGAGIYRQPTTHEKYPLIQHPDDPSLWEDIGYKKITGELSFGKYVVLSRDIDATPKFFTELLEPEDAVQFFKFEDDREQMTHVANMILDNLKKDEVYPHDVLVIFPDAINAAKRGALFIQFLRDRNITAHMTGVDYSRDVFFVSGSVAVSGPYRAKGNEAPIVFLMDSQFCARGGGLIKKRNTLFTAITRSRGWVRVCGFGNEMDVLLDEFKQIKTNEYQLKFRVPTKDELAQMRIQHRDITRDEEKELATFKKSAETLVNRGVDVSVIIDGLPSQLRKEMLKAMQAGSWEDDAE